MPRTSRNSPGGWIYHVLNRGVGRQQLFFKDNDYSAFEDVIQETLDKRSMRILSYSLMPNHWHFVVWPERDGELAAFMQRLTITHVTRWQKHYDCVGDGHAYQGRFKSFPVESDNHFYQVIRHAERNALRAKLVDKAEDWPSGSLWIREHGNRDHRKLLSDWPMPRSRHWLEYVNGVETESELKSLRQSVNRGTPYGSADWMIKTCKALGLESTLQSRGRSKSN